MFFPSRNKMANWTRDFVTYNSHQRPIVGDTKMSALTTDHIGWLKCDGRTLQVADYYFLWRVIGYNFGGSGSNFNLPNPAGRVPGIIGSGVDSNARTFSHSLGDTVGEEVHVLTVAEMPTHTHGVNDPGHTHTYLGVQGQNAGTMGTDTSVAENDPRPTETTSSNVTGITLSNAGLSNAHNNLSPIQFIGSLYIYSGKNNLGVWPQALNGNVY